jgi:hypothetical protein
VGGLIRELIRQLGITVGAAEVWIAIGLAILAAGVFLVVGSWVYRRMDLFPEDATLVERAGIALSLGSMILVGWYAALSSGGRSSFTPVAIAFAAVVVLAAVRRRTLPATSLAPDSAAAIAGGSMERRRAIGLGLFAVIFLVVTALLYGSTMATRSTEAGTPVEFMDTAFYSVLGRDLGANGLENSHSPSGIGLTKEASPQIWYHWGEMWLAAAAIELGGTGPVDARHFIALPLLLLAAAMSTGSLVMRLTGGRSWRPFAFGVAACVTLAPVPVVASTYFSYWATGLLFGITHYGLAAVAILVTMYHLAILPGRRPDWLQAGLVGTATASVLPAHIILALEGVLGLGIAASAVVITTRPSRLAVQRLLRTWDRSIAWFAVVVSASVIWGWLTGHGIGGSAPSQGVTSFNADWRESMLIIALGAGFIYAIPVGLIRAKAEGDWLFAGYLAVIGIVVASAVAWGWRLADFNMFHVFFGALAVYATPFAAVAAWNVARRLRGLGRGRLAMIVLVLCLIQMEISLTLTVARLQRFGPGEYLPIPPPVVAAIEALPADAMIAYRCSELVEIGVWDPRLVSIDAHTGRRIIPMCFQADHLRTLNGAPEDPTVESPFFALAHQRELYPTAEAAPPEAEVESFLRRFGVLYILSDELHPTLIADAPVIVATPTYTLQRLP